MWFEFSNVRKKFIMNLNLFKIFFNIITTNVKLALCKIAISFNSQFQSIYFLLQPPNRKHTANPIDVAIIKTT